MLNAVQGDIVVLTVKKNNGEVATTGCFARYKGETTRFIYGLNRNLHSFVILASSKALPSIKDCNGLFIRCAKGKLVIKELSKTNFDITRNITKEQYAFKIQTFWKEYRIRNILLKITVLPREIIDIICKKKRKLELDSRTTVWLTGITPNIEW